ncbi:glutathione S-transferase family protein [Hoeflea poritis]|uniref:Glutathione S-transferase family protein n=1 Tax=Hoeflea poritis TaxID=2993659 RepID=A0ABT4VLH7_9HYPH|nr:glutathione S-transferase family protein [Hoeflea poritis]MDA4845562.1 glutathione S-transferase family protein [Hoeflea poritis]
MSYVLHNRLGSGGFAIEAVLELAELSYRLDLIDSAPGSDLPGGAASLNPWRQVPVLECPDGKIVTETAAILFYLDEKHASLRDGPHLFVEDRAAFYRWPVFLSVNVYEGFLRMVYPDRYLGPDSDAVGALRKAAGGRIHEAFKLIEDRLNETQYLCGDRLSPADVYCAMLFSWHRKRQDLPLCTRLTERVARHPVVAPVWRKNFDHWLDRKWADEE